MARDLDATITNTRRFNRHWSQVLGLLDRGLLDTEFSLPEGRVLFELGRSPAIERADLRRRLDIDASFLTRLLSNLERQALLERATSPDDGRAVIVSLTEEGSAAAAELNRRSARQIAELLDPLGVEQRARLDESMTVLAHLTGVAPDPAELRLRPLEPGDLGWVIQRNGAIYADEFGWNLDYEALVATIVADFHRNRTEREHAWIAELNGARAGCVFCCRRDDATAQLRILIVEPWARGLALGRHLVDTCVDFATSTGYERIMLWTNDVLVAARRIYVAAGFELVEEEPHHSFGHDLVGQIWERQLP